MASYEIPEEIIGVPLFVPDGHDYFSIESGGMPNGDDCLVVHGDVSPYYKAFQPAPSVSPDLFRDRTAGGWAMVFWFRGGLVTVVGTPFSPLNAVIAVTSSTFTGNTVGGNANTSGYGRQTGATGIVWGVGASNNSLGFGRPVTSQVTANWGTTITDNQWHMLVLNRNSNNSFALYKDNDATAVDTMTGSTASGAASDPFLCIGSYSDNGDCQGRPGEYRLGKLSFHDHVLDQTERSLLWNAMMS